MVGCASTYQMLEEKKKAPTFLLRRQEYILFLFCLPNKFVETPVVRVSNI